MTLNEQIMKLQTYKMFDGEDTVYVERDDVLKLLEQEPILDKIIADIEQVKSIINEEIINHNRKDLIHFINGLNQSLVIIDKYKTESEVQNADSN